MKALQWFRMYTEFLDDPKMIAISFEDQRHFIGLCALKAAGVLDSTDDERMLNRLVAQKLWLDFATIDQVKERLVHGELIGDDWQPLAWERRQCRSDSDPTAAERQRSKRAREAAARRVKAAQDKADRGVTRDITRDVTHPSRTGVTNVTRTEGEVEEEIDTEKQQTRTGARDRDIDPGDPGVEPDPDDQPIEYAKTREPTAGAIRLTVPPPPASLDVERIFINDTRVEAGIRAYLEVFVSAGYDLLPLVNDRSVGILAGWARAGYQPTKLAAELTTASKSSDGPIRAPVQYLAAKIGQLPPKLKTPDGSSALPDTAAYEAAAAKKLEAMKQGASA